MRRHPRTAASGLTVAVLALATVAAAGSRPTLEESPPVERRTLQQLLTSDSWPRRAIAAVRLERFGCGESAEVLARLLEDPAWQVRAFAVASLGRRKVAAGPLWLAAEEDPKVMRTALRHRYTIDQTRLEHGIRNLARQRNLGDKMLAVELAATSTDDELVELARETLRLVVIRMNRPQAGALSSRIASVTGQRNIHRSSTWQRWLRKAGRRFEIHPAFAVPEGAERPGPTMLASLEPEHFASLKDYMDSLSDRAVDLAICLDTTASMSGELAQAQGGIDELMVFAGEVVGELRVGLVAYRDRRNRYETLAWNFTGDNQLARERLWKLTAGEGGDTPEAVYPALRRAYTDLDWQADHVKILVLVGDAPPHVGYGTQCVRMAALAFEQSKLTTHAIQAEGQEVKHFPEIAAAGHGRCVSLEDDDALIPEITGLTLGDRYDEEVREFFRMYLAFCR